MIKANDAATHAHTILQNRHALKAPPRNAYRGGTHTVSINGTPWVKQDEAPMDAERERIAQGRRGADVESIDYEEVSEARGENKHSPRARRQHNVRDEGTKTKATHRHYLKC